MRSSFAQIVNITGDTTVSYKSYYASGTNGYGEPLVGYSTSTITALVQPLDDKELLLREPGFEPEHYTKIFLKHTSDLTPAHLDHYTANSIEYEVRSVIPRSVGDTIVYYECVGRRL